MKQKTSFNLIKTDFAAGLVNDYPLLDLQVIEVTLPNHFFITFIKFKNETTLAAYWDKLNSVVTAELSTELKTAYQRWNMYCFYLCEEAIADHSLKYKIENDMFSTRKIVMDNIKPALTPAAIQQWISRYITNDDLKYDDKNEQQPLPPSYEFNSTVFNLMQQSNIMALDKKQQPIQLEALFNDIARALTNEN